MEEREEEKKGVGEAGEGRGEEKEREAEDEKEEEDSCSQKPEELKINYHMQIYQQMSVQQSLHQYHWTSQPQSCLRRGTGKVWPRPPLSGKWGGGRLECGSG